MSSQKDLYAGFGEGVMVLKYAAKLDMFRRMKGWKISQMAEKIRVTGDRMEALLSGQHEPKAGDIIKAERYLDIQFEPEDFNTEGLVEGKKG